MANRNSTRRNPWAWVPSVYLAEGLPYAVVMNVAAILYKGLGISNTELALATAWLYLPWVIKPLWSPFVDILGTRRRWIWIMQFIIGAGLAGVALVIPAGRVFQYSLAFFYLLAFSSATQDIAIDGFYLLATTEQEQSFFVGIRSTFYRIAMIFGQGVLVIFAGVIQDHTGLPKISLAISAQPGAAIIRNFEAPPPATNSENALRVISPTSPILISPEPRPSAEVKSLIAIAKSNNIANGFCAAEPKLASAAGWSLESFLRSHFGTHVAHKPDAVGNIGIATLRLSQPPGRTVVLTLGANVGFGLKSGDEKNFSLVEGARLTFDDHNWNLPALVVIQLDPKLRAAAATNIEIRSGNIPFSWSCTFWLMALMFAGFGAFHRFIMPWPEKDVVGSGASLASFWREFLQTFAAFFRKDKIGILLLFLLFYRFAEAQLVKMVAPFLLDAREAGGLGLTTSQLGIAYGGMGILALTFGGVLGGFVAAKQGLRFWIWWMVLAIHLPDCVFIYLAYAQPDNFWIINLCVAVEQFGYGFGFTAYMLYMIYISRGQHATAHYAICTGFMALGMMIPGMWSGWLQEVLGYNHFFMWVILATIPGILIVKLIPMEAGFGRRK